MMVRLKVNGEERMVDVEPNERLLDVFRDKLFIRSVKPGCWRGECGTCTVIMDGELVKSCLILAVEADGSEITTVEGLLEDGKLNPLQKAFVELGGFQCGFCTPAFLLSAHWLLSRNPNASEDEIKEVLNAVLCRCVGYKQIIEAVKAAAGQYGRA